MIKYILILCYLSLNLPALEKLNLGGSYVYHDTKELLESISKDAIKFGTGDKSVSYVFVDPMCPFSREYITSITANEALLKKTTFFLFLYRLPKFPSDSLIQYIYQGDNPFETLKKVMVKKEEVNLENLPEVQGKLSMIYKISKVAKKLDVKVRPYLIKYKKGTNYCDVSNGRAICEEIKTID